MEKHIAFLRAINVGGHSVKMDILKQLFEAMGFKKVETFIASGNVVFESKSKNIDLIKQKIERHLEKSLDYKVVAFLRTADELKEISEFVPFKRSDLRNSKYSLYIGFLDSEPRRECKKKTIELSDKANEFIFSKKELYWLCRKNFSDSGISGKTLEKALGMEMTIRNSTTIKKMADKFY